MTLSALSAQLGSLGQVDTKYITGAVSLAVITAAVGFLSKLILEALKQQGAVRAARSMAYAQLHRVAELAHGEQAWIADGSRDFMWIPVFDLNLPSQDALKQFEFLTPNEVYEITSFFYYYHEQVGYLLGNAKFMKAEDDRWGDPLIFPVGAQFHAPVIGYDFSQAGPKEWLLDSLGKIERRARRARNTIGGVITSSPMRDRSMVTLVKRHLDQDDARRVASERTSGEMIAAPDGPSC